MTGGRTTWTAGPVEAALRAAPGQGRKLLVTYVTGGLGTASGWTPCAAMVDGGADLVEVGIPFSDPVMDGPTIQEASVRALAAGATPGGILEALRPLEVPVPLVAMTYYNLVFRAGHARFAHLLAESGVRGAIVPDLPLEESGALGGRGGRGRGRDHPPGRPGHPRRPAGRAVPAVPRLRLRGQHHGRHRRAEVAGRLRGRPGQAAQGHHRQAGHHGLRGLDARAGGGGGGRGGRRGGGLGAHAAAARRSGRDRRRRSVAALRSVLDRG